MREDKALTGGRDEACGRLKCSGPDVPVHQGKAHLDPRSEHYDGPDTMLAVLPLAVRESARRIIRLVPEVTPEVADLGEHILFLKDQVAHVSVDRDHKVREASRRALDCADHGEVIKRLEEQVSAFDQSARRSEAGRLAVLGLLHELDAVVRRFGTGEVRADLTLPELVEALKKAVDGTRRAHDRAWRDRGTRS